MEPVIEGHESMAHVLEVMQRDTRQFARRQRTWLRKVPEAIWVHPDEEDAIVERVEKFLSEKE